MDLASWANFAVAAVGVSGALAGLIFVGISLNLDFVLQNGHLPARAATALATLLSVAVLNLCLLIPAQSAAALAVEAALLAAILVVLAVMTCVSTLRRRRPGDPWSWVVQPLVLNLLTPCLMAATAVAVVWGHDVRLLPAATVSGLVVSVWEAWVLLVEIRR